MKRLISVLVIILFCLAAVVPEASATVEQQQFPFQVILTDAGGKELTGSYEYTGSKTGILQSGDVVWLADGEHIDILELPAGTQYHVIEQPTSGYGLKSSENTQGSIERDALSHASFVNEKVDERPIMPSTGGTLQVWQAGAATMLFAGIGLAITQRRRQERKKRI